MSRNLRFDSFSAYHQAKYLAMGLKIESFFNIYPISTHARFEDIAPKSTFRRTDIYTSIWTLTNATSPSDFGGGADKKSMLGCVTPFRCPISVYKSDAECCLLQFWVEMAKWPWRSRSITPIFNICWEYPRIHVWCKFGDSSPNLWQVIMWTSRISQNSESKWPWRSRSINPIFNTSREYPMRHFWCNLVIPAQICDESSCRQVKFTAVQTDGWADRHRQQQHPFGSGLKDQGVEKKIMMLKKKNSEGYF